MIFHWVNLSTYSKLELNLHCVNFASDDSVLYINNSSSPQNGASSTNSPKYSHYATIDHSRRHGSKNSSKINNSNTISGSATTGRPTKGLMHSASCPFKVNSSSFSDWLDPYHISWQWCPLFRMSYLTECRRCDGFVCFLTCIYMILRHIIFIWHYILVLE